MFKQRCFRLLLLASAIATSLSAAAYSFESAGIYYNITGNNTVEVTYSDRDNNTYSGSISVPETVTNNGTEYSVTKIGEYAFQGSAVTSVSMPECITSIGQYACNECGSLETVVLPTNLDDFSGWCIFRNCRNLKNIAIPENVTEIPNGTFINCSSLAAITIPQGVGEIGSNAFYGCSSLTSIEIPEGVKYLYEQVFYGCTALESVKLPQNLLQIGKNCFYNCGALSDISLPSSIEIIGEGAFYNCENLASPTLPTSLRTLVKSAFQYCRNITTIVLPDGVASIPESCFDGCSSLESVTIPEGVTTIGEKAFFGCNLNALTLPSTITSIGGGAFINNYNLQSIICNAVTPPTLDENAIGSSVKEIKVPISSIAAYKQANGWKNFSNYCSGEVVNNGITYHIDENGATITAAEATLTEANIPSVVEFEGNQYPVIKINDRVFSDNINLTSVKIDNGLVEICRLAFNGCQNLESVMLPESLTTLGSEAFSFCKSLRAVKIPSGVTAIPDQCFDGCSSLNSETIPEGVTAIGDHAFGSCCLNALTLPESLEKIGGYAFTGNKSLKSVNIPAKVKTIETEAFNSCGLTELVIPEGVQTIGYNTFGRNSLQNLTLPSTVTSIGGSAFDNNNNLQSIICNAVTPPTLDGDAFSIGITPSIKVPMASIAAYRKAYGWKDFSNYYGGEVVADGITYRIDENGAMVAAVEPSLTEANVPSTVEFEGNQYPVIKINDNVFAGNTNLTAVTLPDGLVEIGNGAFSGCIYNHRTTKTNQKYPSVNL